MKLCVSVLGEVYLVMGVVGFVGLNVVMVLKRRGAGVVGLDNVNDYYSRGLKWS